MNRLRYPAIKEEGKKVRLENGHDFRVQLELLPPDRYFVEVYKEYKKATPKQFAWLYNGVYPKFLEALIDAGYEFTTVEEVDLFAKSMWAAKPVLNMETGEIQQIPVSKAEFLTIDHQAFVNNIIYYCAVYLNVSIPPPDVNWKKHKEEVKLLINKQNNAA